MHFYIKFLILSKAEERRVSFIMMCVFMLECFFLNISNTKFWSRKNGPKVSFGLVTFQKLIFYRNHFSESSIVFPTHEENYRKFK